MSNLIPFLAAIAVVLTIIEIIQVLVRWSERRIHDRFRIKTGFIDPEVRAVERHMVTNVRVIHRLYDWQREDWF